MELIPKLDEYVTRFKAAGMDPHRIELFEKYFLQERFAKAFRMTRKQICGARKKDGKSCMSSPIDPTRRTGNGRCKFHGGLSTGPRTLAGKRALAEGRARYWRQWRRDHNLPAKPGDSGTVDISELL